MTVRSAPTASYARSATWQFLFALAGMMSVAATVFFHESSEIMAMANGLRVAKGSCEGVRDLNLCPRI